MRIRPADPGDAPAILALHLRSWRETYRGLMPDTFLDGAALPQRLRSWYVQMAQPRPERLLALAEQADDVVGFICVQARADRDFGSRIESLHVLPESQRLGAGTHLMHYGAQWLQNQEPGLGVYVWVMQRNTRARCFYERLGGVEVARRERPDPSGGHLPHCRYAWRTPADLLRPRPELPEAGSETRESRDARAPRAQL